MKGCNEIKRLIDEADQPEMFPFEVSTHTAACDGCRDFAAERTALRNLLASDARVTAPANFNAALNARLAEVKARRKFSWVSPAGFMRLGAATAGLVIALFVMQFSGLLSTPEQTQQPNPNGPIANGEPAPPPATPEIKKPPIAGNPGSEKPDIRRPFENTPVTVSRSGRANTRRPEIVVTPPSVPDIYSGMEDGGIALVRGRSGERVVPLPTVSVGAQPLLYVGTTQPATRSAGTSF